MHIKKNKKIHFKTYHTNKYRSSDSVVLKRGCLQSAFIFRDFLQTTQKCETDAQSR